jgi:hypothetical protein
MHSGYEFVLLFLLSHGFLYDNTIFLQKRYKLSEDGSYDLNTCYMFEYNVNDVVAYVMYYAQLKAIKA